MITKLYENKNDITGVPSGFYDLDKMTSGFQNSELIIIGARPQLGKQPSHFLWHKILLLKEKYPQPFLS